MKSGEAMEAGTAERELYTLAQAYQDISAGTEPWVALNEFLHEWFEYAKDQRSQLIAERIPAGDSLEKASQHCGAGRFSAPLPQIGSANRVEFSAPPGQMTLFTHSPPPGIASMRQG